MERLNKGKKEKEKEKRTRTCSFVDLMRASSYAPSRLSPVGENSNASSSSDDVIFDASSDIDDNVSISGIEESETCSNCQRYGLLCIVAQKKDIRSRRKWATGVALYFKDNDEYNSAVLCEGCHEYLTNEKSRNNDGSLVWQCFVYRKLTDCQERIQLWTMFPFNFRKWWINYARDVLHMNNISLEYPEALTRDGTVVMEELRKMTANLGNVGWGDFQTTWEKHQALPIVRCPWGCSEYYRSTNTVAFDVFIAWYLGGSTELYSSESERRCSTGFRKDIISNPVHILNNPDPSWRCLVTFKLMDTKEMRVCTCRYHSSKDFLEYIHAPANPTGVISFGGDNNLAQVVVIPRTIRPFQAKSYSHSYQLNRAMGTYSGIDTVDLCGELDFGEHERSHLSFTRDMIAMNQRTDYRSFVSHLPKKDHQVTQKDANTLLNESDELCEGQEEAFRQKKNGATYVPLEDVFDLQMQIKKEGSRSIIHINQDNGENRSTNFVPKWPRRIVRVMPAGSEYGSLFTNCRGFEKKEVIFWFVLSISYIVPEIWHSMDSSVKTNQDWEGWVLTYIVTHVLHHKAMKTIRNNPFVSKELTIKKIRDRLQSECEMATAEPMLFLFISMERLFCRNTGVKVINHARDMNTEDNVEVVIVVFEEECLSDFLFPDFDLRVIGCYSEDHNTRNSGTAGKGKIFAKHGNGFRFQEIIQKDHRGGCNCSVSDVQIMSQLERTWQYLVFVRRVPTNCKAMRDSLLELQGGQTKITCKKHAYPLISAPHSKSNSRICILQGCRKKIFFRCPGYKCVVGLCKKDFTLLLNNSEESVVIGMANNHIGVNAELDGSNRMDIEIEENSESEDEHHFADDESVDFEFNVADEDDGSVLEILPDGVDELWEAEIEDINDLGSDVSNDGYEDLDTYSIPITSTSRKRLHFDSSKSAKEGISIPNHVLLNSQGNLLIRHHKKLSLTAANRHFLQKLTATYEGDGIPLIYPEATLFPAFFWSQEPDFSNTGAIPSILFQDNVTLNNLGFASLYDHCRTRLIDPGLLSSTDPRYLSFMWDKMANLGLRGSNTEMVLRRGFAEMTGYEGLCMVDADQPVYDSFAIDSRATVNQLAAANARKPCDLFFTFTCNQKQTFGVRKIWEWVESDQALRNIAGVGVDGDIWFTKLRSDEKEAKLAREALRISAGIFTLRTWIETVTIFLQYIQFGKDSPFLDICGGIKDLWARLEIQNEEDGKVPHCHATVYFRDPPDTQEKLFSMLNLIRSCTETFVTKKEEEELIEKGFISDPGLMIAFLEDMQMKLTHWCTTRCMIQTRIVESDGSVVTRKERKCKQPDYRRMSENPTMHTFMDIDISHSQEALHALTDLGMIETGYDIHVPGIIEKCVPKSEFKHLLEARRHLPPCYSTDRRYSPANPFLFAMLLSAMNLQFVTAYILLRYLTKYIASVDKSIRIVFKGSKDGNDERNIRADIEEGHNTKITSNKIAQKEKDCKNRNSQFELHGRAISLAEQTMQLLRYGSIITSFHFIFIPTQQMALRPMIKKSSAVSKYQKQGLVSKDATGPSDLDANRVFPGQKVRKDCGFPEGRQFDNFQIISYLDSMFQPGSIDRVTAFGLRPPELRFVTRLSKYWTFFVRTPTPGYTKVSQSHEGQVELLSTLLDLDYFNCLWIDGLGCRIVIRRQAVPSILKFIEDIPEKHTVQDFGSLEQRKATETLFRELLLWCEDTNVTTRNQNVVRCQLALRFVMEETNPVRDRLPVYWFRTMKATESDNFLYHLLLSLGNFSTELELLSQGSMLQSFIHARLFTESEDANIRETSAMALIRKYVNSQLVHLPSGTRVYDQQLIAATRAIRGLLLDDTIVTDDLPSALFTKIRDQCEEEVHTFCKQRKDSLTKSMHRQLKLTFPTLPSLEDVQASDSFSNPVTFDLAGLPRSPEQSIESYEEHRKARVDVVKSVAHYKLASLERTKAIAFVGAGGVGKTVEMLLAGLYCISQGLFVITTSLAGKRSAENNGEHIHLAFQLPTNETLTAVQAAERAVIQLHRDPKRLQLLMRADVILLDELGAISAQLLAILDMIMRRIRKSSHWFGGCLLFTTVDHRQLKPITGLSPFLCPSLISSFIFRRFEVTLRTHNKELQRIQAISRMPADTLDDTIKEEFSNLLRTHCSWAETIDAGEIPENAVFCFARHEPCKRAEIKILRRAKDRYREFMTSRLANDWESSLLQNHSMPATATTSDALDKAAKPPRELFFYPYAAYELTYNDSKHRFFQSQLCMILDKIPSQEQLDKFEDIVVYRAPHGIDELPEIPTNKEKLLEADWVEIRVGKHPDRKYSLGNYGLTGSRDQYGLKHRIALTIHAVMGCTVPTLVTQVGLSKQMALWEAAQTVVTLSRTRLPSDMWFIGDPTETIDVLWQALLSTDQFSVYVTHLLDTLCSRSHEKQFVINQTRWHPFRACDMELPKTNDLCSYMLASRRETSVVYVGSTNNMRRRYDEHNSKVGGSTSTGLVNLKPWGLLGYVVGFSCRHDASIFEFKWKAIIQTERRGSRDLPTMTRLFLARQVISEWLDPGELKLVICGQV